MSAKAATAPLGAAPAEAPAKGKSKKLVIILAAVVLLAGAGGGGWFFFMKKNHDAASEEAAAPEPKKKEKPTYLAMENMVVNLADPGGEKFAQVGITLDLENEKASEELKAIMPAVRSKVLLLVSQRTSDELLRRDGKEKLADDIVAEVSRTMGFEVEAPAPKAKEKTEKAAKASADDEEPPVRKKKKKAAEPSPVRGVLFSAFIVQ